jgi:hypothetical protein
MNSETMQKWAETARGLWESSPELQTRYPNVAAYIGFVCLRVECQQEWVNSPSLQKEFSGNFYLFLTYRKAVMEGKVTVCGEGG